MISVIAVEKTMRPNRSQRGKVDLLGPSWIKSLNVRHEPVQIGRQGLPSQTDVKLDT
ncbi:hypothetical protein KIP88_43180 [Bradyrhizobium sp. SRL28]|uniref:hypothetical protein n=1 Tax=Bradyrhizobium sp. SRL28 TaxID=2836178 RepID=UPI001BDE13AE|nr:hypothetical protein [Bradyrhizobium sp. SRL28]MBT1517151.1 hypothetical protein [Bradyrhizobium sp. SRL28]